MADKCHMCLLGLIILCLLLKGSSGVDDTHMFRSSGENVHLPCNNAFSDCTSTTWTYSRQSVSVELISGGKKNDIERHERLSLGSDCSLNIKKVTKEDYGFYTCQQYVNEQQVTDARVRLYFLHVSSSSSQTEIRPGSSVTLYCQLHYDRVSCDTLVRTEGVQLIWVNQAGVTLQTDSRYQISFSSGQCISTLTTTLLNEDHNREWRCLLSQRNEPKTSATYTIMYSAPVDSTILTPVSTSNSEKKKSSQTSATAPTQQAPVDSTILTPVSTSNSEKKKSSQTSATAPTQQAPVDSTILTPVSTSNSEKKKSSQTSATAPTQQDAADTTSETEVSKTAGLLFRVIVIIIEIAVFAAPTVIILQIICARRAGRKNSLHPEEIEMPTVLQ